MQTQTFPTPTDISLSQTWPGVTKNRLLNFILALMPEHYTYIEPFAGTAPVFFAKTVAERSILNNLTDEFKTLYRASAYHYPQNKNPGPVVDLEGRLHKLQSAMVIEADSLECIRHYDLNDAPFFIDPPAVGTYGAGAKRWTYEDLERLGKCLNKIKGKFIYTGFSYNMEPLVERYGWYCYSPGLSFNRCLITNFKVKELPVQSPVFGIGADCLE